MGLLRQSEERFRTIAENIAQLAWTGDTVGNVTWYNQRWLDYTGLSFDDMNGWVASSVSDAKTVLRTGASTCS